MKRLIVLLVLCSVLSGCEAFGDLQHEFSRATNPEAHRAYDAQVKPQKKTP